jgi:hypothetical protein
LLNSARACALKDAFQPKLLGFPKGGYLAIALLVRLLLAPFFSHPFDERVFMAVGASVARGITPYGQYVLQDIFASTPHPHLYGTVLGIGYPPPWGLICGDMYVLSSMLAPGNLYAYVLALKLPVIAGELALAVLVYRILRKEVEEKTAFKAFLLFLFCPFLITTGTVWGMFDTLALFFAVFSAYSLNSNWKMSSVYLSVASVLKLFPLTLAPLYSVLVYKTEKNLRKACLFFTVTAALTATFTFVPMIVCNWPLSNMYNALGYHVTVMNNAYGAQTVAQAGVAAAPYDAAAAFPYGAASPFNVFTLLNGYVSTSVQPPDVSVYLWIPACIAVYVFLLRSNRSSRQVSKFAVTVQWSLLLMLTLFTTRVWVSEQNLAFLFAFFALTVYLMRLDLASVHMLWIMLLCFVVVHVPAVSFLWLPYPWTLDSATAFANGPLGWTRLLMMTMLTFSWLVLSWHFVVKKLRWNM